MSAAILFFIFEQTKRRSLLRLAIKVNPAIYIDGKESAERIAVIQVLLESFE